MSKFVYVKDKKILDRLGISNTSDTFAVYTKNKNITDDELIKEEALISSYINNDIEDVDIDNSKCNADFEKVDDGYTSIENYMYGDIKVFRKTSSFIELIGIYDKTGLYKMQSVKGTYGYLGHNGKAKCIAIPQCKFMNSTIFDNIAEHKVYTGDNLYTKKSKLLGEFNVNEYLNNHKFLKLSSHISFDKWVVIGAVLGKVLRVWRGIAKMDIKKMPLYMTVTFSEIYETIVDGSKWENLSDESRYEWVSNLNSIFEFLNNGMIYDLPENKKRHSYYANHIMENTWIKRRAVCKEDENRCMKYYGEVFEPYAVKIKVRGSLLFDFCWKDKNSNPSLVQIRNYDYNLKKIFGGRRQSYNKSFSVIYASWLIQYRNYWIKRDKEFKSCKAVWSRSEMKYAFDGSIFDINYLTTEEMKKVIEWYTVSGVFNSNMKRPAHIAEYHVNKRCELGWTLPANLSDEAVLLKNENNKNIGLMESGIKDIPDEVKLAFSRMNGINAENMKHVATIDGVKITMNEAVIYRTKYDAVNKVMKIEEGLNGRCYSLANGVQGLKRDDRKRLKIDGNKVSEVDYSSLHPHMLYALNGIYTNKNKDMYDVGKWYVAYNLSDNDARKAVKMMLLRMINAKNKFNALYSFKHAWNEEHGIYKRNKINWLYNLYNAIKSYHSQIAHEFCTGKGTHLMNLDGKLIREVCWRLTREKICALGIHDSVIVEKKYCDKAKKIMEEEYEKMFKGFTIKVKIK